MVERQGKITVFNRDGFLSMQVEGELTAGEWIYAIETFKNKLLNSNNKGMVQEWAKKLNV